MTEDTLSGPVLFCFDGSDGSRGAMRAAANLIKTPVDAVVITVWETVATRLALSGAFAAGNTTGVRTWMPRKSPLPNQLRKRARGGRPSTGTAPRRWQGSPSRGSPRPFWRWRTTSRLA